MSNGTRRDATRRAQADGVAAVRISGVCAAGTRCPEPESFGSYSALADAPLGVCEQLCLPLCSALLYGYSSRWTRDAERRGVLYTCTVLVE